MLLICFSIVLVFCLAFADEPVYVSALLSVNGIYNIKSENENHAINNNVSDMIFSILDENGNIVDVRENVEEGDFFVLSNLKTYEIKSVNSKNKTAKAEYMGDYKLPKILFSENVKLVNNKNKLVGLYMSHNDESYLEGDGVESVYGEGGIHDVANTFAKNLSDLGIETILDETLHLPHDSSAYSRSKTTALGLITDDANYIFDIHRDGAPKNAFVVNCDGEECCQIRLVVGQNNNNQEENLNLASNIFAVGNKMYPNLFKDIYFGKGSYNQNLSGNALLFEMGSHEVPKNLVIDATKKLADVLNKALFESDVKSNGDLVVYKNNTNNKPTLLNNKQVKKQIDTDLLNKNQAINSNKNNIDKVNIGFVKHKQHYEQDLH